MHLRDIGFQELIFQENLNLRSWLRIQFKQEIFEKHLCPLPLDIAVKKMNGNYKNMKFSKSKGQNFVENSLIVPKIWLVLDIKMINLYIRFYYNMWITCEENERKLQIIGIFLSPRRITLSNNCSIVLSQMEFDLAIIFKNLCTKIHLSKCNFCKENVPRQLT